MYVVCYNVCCNVINLTLSMHEPEGYGSHCMCVCVCGRYVQYALVYYKLYLFFTENVCSVVKASFTLYYYVHRCHWTFCSILE